MHLQLPLPLAAILAATLALTGCTLTPTNFSNIQEVDRLCAKDGGIRVYQTIPNGKFKKVETKRLPDGHEFIYLSEDGQYRYASKTVKLPGASGNGISRQEMHMWRTSDEKLLGTAIGYGTSSGEASMPNFVAHTCDEFKGNPVGWLFSRAMHGVKEAK